MTAAKRESRTPQFNPATLPFVGFDGARALLGNCSETYVRQLVADRVLHAPIRLPGGRGRLLFDTAVLIADIKRYAEAQ